MGNKMINTKKPMAKGIVGLLGALLSGACNPKYLKKHEMKLKRWPDGRIRPNFDNFNHKRYNKRKWRTIEK